METSLKFPVGDFERVNKLTEEQRLACIRVIAETPAQLRAAVAGLNDAQLETPYRPGGWTVRQVVHHLADSHMNSYVRFRLALTEDEPTIKTYDEARWAELSDAKTAPIESSLKLMDSLHERWALLLRTFRPNDWTRTFRHPALRFQTSLVSRIRARCGTPFRCCR